MERDERAEHFLDSLERDLILEVRAGRWMERSERVGRLVLKTETTLIFVKEGKTGQLPEGSGRA